MPTHYEENVSIGSNATLLVSGNAIFNGDVTLPDSVITDGKVATGAEVDADKLQHRHALNYYQDAGGDVVNATKVIHVCRGAGQIKSIVVRPLTVPAGGDKNYTIDVKKASNGSAVFATLLNAVITVNSSSVNQTKQTGALIGTPTVAADDAIQVVVTTGGTTGSQGQGFVVTVNIEEAGA